MHAAEQPLTIKDIARMAGVSIGTVDRVLHKRGRVRPETEARIREVIERTSYEPAVFASRLSKSRSSSLGIIMPLPEQDSGYWELCRKGLEKAAADLRMYNVGVQYFYFDRHSLRSAEEAVQAASDSVCDGFLLAPVITEFFIRVLDEKKLGNNIIMFDSELPDSRYASCVSQDSRASGRLAARLLLQSMYEACAISGTSSFDIYVAGIAGTDYHLQQRIAGFSEYLAERKIPVHTIEESGATATAVAATTANTTAVAVADRLAERPSISKGDPAGLFVPNASTHVYSRVSSFLETTEFRLIGYDEIPENIEAVKQGRIHYLLSQRPEEQAVFALSNLYRFSILKKKIVERIIMPIDIITIENLPSQNSMY